MSDFIDQTDEREEFNNQVRLTEIRKKSVIDPGVAGECTRCGDEVARLISGTCAPCRDRYKLP
jgi:hypothetical protein